MTARPADGYFKYRSHSVAFQIFYDIKLLEKLDRKSFLPWEKPFENSSRKKRTNNFEVCVATDNIIVVLENNMYNFR